MQNKDEKNLALRSRYYQAEMDVASLQPGDAYKQLKPCMIIFLCTFDPFGRGLFRYTYETRCVEDDCPLDDGVTRIFLNTKGTNPETVPDSLLEFLRYIENSTDAFAATAQNPKIRKLHRQIHHLKQNRKWRNRFMTLKEYIQLEFQEDLEEYYQQGHDQGHREGHAKGHAEGRLQLLHLIQSMQQCGDGHRIADLASDDTLLSEMLEKYHL